MRNGLKSKVKKIFAYLFLSNVKSSYPRNIDALTAIKGIPLKIKKYYTPTLIQSIPKATATFLGLLYTAEVYITSNYKNTSDHHYP
jgi:hypothetical protein